MKDRIELLKADITKVQADAWVTAANAQLMGGGGVDGAIHRIAGPELLHTCRLLRGCPTGQAKITKGFQAPVQYIIHAVGPVWFGGSGNEANLLASAYREALALCLEHKIGTVVFPNLSTGVYKFPKVLASRIAIKTVISFLADHAWPQKIIFACYDDENYDLYAELLRAHVEI
jgi:O-acetyl-ADP-ribose deacetylase (regulator of RNase III)